MDCRTDLERQLHAKLIEQIKHRNMMPYDNGVAIDYQLLAQLDAKSKGLPYCEVKVHEWQGRDEMPQVHYNYFCFTPPFYNKSQLYQPSGGVEGGVESGFESMPY